MLSIINVKFVNNCIILYVAVIKFNLRQSDAVRGAGLEPFNRRLLTVMCSTLLVRGGYTKSRPQDRTTEQTRRPHFVRSCGRRGLLGRVETALQI